MGKGKAMNITLLGTGTPTPSFVITHVTEQMDTVGMHEKLLREMGEIYDGNLIWGEDLMSIPLKGPKPRALK